LLETEESPLERGALERLWLAGKARTARRALRQLQQR